jgi:ribonuclease R
LKRKRSSSKRDASPPRKRGPGRRAGPPKWLPEAPPAPSRKPGKATPRPPRVDDPHAAREASRYERPIPSREAILAFLTQHGQLMKAEAIADELGLNAAPGIRSSLLATP